MENRKQKRQVESKCSEKKMLTNAMIDEECFSRYTITCYQDFLKTLCTDDTHTIYLT